MAKASTVLIISLPVASGRPNGHRALGYFSMTSCGWLVLRPISRLFKTPLWLEPKLTGAFIIEQAGREWEGEPGARNLLQVLCNDNDVFTDFGAFSRKDVPQRPWTKDPITSADTRKSQAHAQNLFFDNRRKRNLISGLERWLIR